MRKAKQTFRDNMTVKEMSEEILNGGHWDMPNAMAFEQAETFLHCALDAAIAAERAAVVKWLRDAEDMGCACAADEIEGGAHLEKP